MTYILIGALALCNIILSLSGMWRATEIRTLKRKMKWAEDRINETDRHFKALDEIREKGIVEFIKQFKEEIALIHSHLGVEKIVEESVEKPIVGQIAKGGFKGGDMFKLDEVENQYGESYIKKTAKLKKKTNKLKR